MRIEELESFFAPVQENREYVYLSRREFVVLQKSLSDHKIKILLFDKHFAIVLNYLELQRHCQYR